MTVVVTDVLRIFNSLPFDIICIKSLDEVGIYMITLAFMIILLIIKQ